MLAAIEILKSIDFDTLVMIVLAVLLGFAGIAQRKTGQASDFPLLCPNKVEEIGPKIDELTRAIEAASAESRAGREACAELIGRLEKMGIYQAGGARLAQERHETLLAALQRIESRHP